MCVGHNRKTAETIKIPFGVLTCVGPTNHIILDEIHMGATWQIRLNALCSAMLQVVATITVVTCISSIL